MNINISNVFEGAKKVWAGAEPAVSKVKGHTPPGIGNIFVGGSSPWEKAIMNMRKPVKEGGFELSSSAAYSLNQAVIGAVGGGIYGGATAIFDSDRGFLSGVIQGASTGAMIGGGLSYLATRKAVATGFVRIASPKIIAKSYQDIYKSKAGLYGGRTVAGLGVGALFFSDKRKNKRYSTFNHGKRPQINQMQQENMQYSQMNQRRSAYRR